VKAGDIVSTAYSCLNYFGIIIDVYQNYRAVTTYRVMWSDGKISDTQIPLKLISCM